jgi:hypothetical protein
MSIATYLGSLGFPPFSKKAVHRFVFDHETYRIRRPTIVAYGIPRSGSTLIYQVLCQLFPAQDVIKAHHFLYAQNLTRVVMCSRDLRDVLISQWRVAQDLSGQQFIEKQVKTAESPQSPEKATLRSMTDEEVRYGAQQVLKQIEGSFKQYLEVDPSCVIKLAYEQFFENFHYLFRELEKFFNISIDLDTRARIEKTCNLAANRSRADQLHGFKEFDPNTQIHGKHIHSGVTEFWKNFLTPGQVAIANGILGPLLRTLEYEVS